MQNIELGEPFDRYMQSLVDTKLYANTEEVLKDALRQHIYFQNENKKSAYFMEAIAEGETDIKAGRVDLYSPELIDQIDRDVISNG